MKYFRLLDDVTYPGRWHVGAITSDEEDVSDSLWDGRHYIGGPLSAEVTTDGTKLDFCLTSFAVPIGTTAAADAIQREATRDLQRIPLVGTSYEVLNSVRVVDCLDEGSSEFQKWTPTDGYPDKVGEYRQVTSLKLNPSCIPKDAHFFRVQGWLIALIVSTPVKEALEAMRGPVFIPVS